MVENMLNTFAKVLNDIFRHILFEHGLVKSQNTTKTQICLKMSENTKNDIANSFQCLRKPTSSAIT